MKRPDQRVNTGNETNKVKQIYMNECPGKTILELSKYLIKFECNTKI